MGNYLNGTGPTQGETAPLSLAPPIPANIEAERAVLGSLLIDPDVIGKIAGELKVEHFYRERHGWIYGAMLAIHERHEMIDFVILVDELERFGQLEDVGGPAYLTDLISQTPTAMYAAIYARIVIACATRRNLISAAGHIAEIAYDERRDLPEVLDEAEKFIFDVGQSFVQRDVLTLKQSLTIVVDRLDFLARNRGMIMGIPSGFTQLDRILGGFQKGDLVVVGGRAGMGKSSWGLSVAINAAKKFNARVALFTLEMSHEQMTTRMLSMEAGIDSHRLRMGDVTDDEWPRLLESANTMAAYQIFIDDTPAASVLEIRTKARRIYAEQGLDMIVIDYMQIMSGQSQSNGYTENRQQEISYIARSLKALARELNVPVIALSQLSRAVESRADKRPTLSDLRESGSIEQEADVVLFIYREDYYVENSDRQNIADIIVAKHRHGATGTASLFFRKELTQFRDLEVIRTELMDNSY